MSTRRSAAVARLLAVVAWPLLAVGCHPPTQLVTVTSSPDILEGRPARVTFNLRNVLQEAIIPVSLTVYERRDATGQFATRRILVERELLHPVQAARVRHMRTLSRVEADQMRDAGALRRVPDTRFLHPHILLPGDRMAETVTLQAIAAHRHSLYCDLYYFRLTSEEIRGRLFVRDPTLDRRRDEDHYTEVYVLADPDQLADPEPGQYLLYRRRVPKPQAVHILTKRIPLRVQPRPFSYREAAARAKAGHKARAYFTPAEAWVFDYGDGTWFVTRSASVKLRGRYLGLIVALESEQAPTLGLTAARGPDDPLLDFFQKSGYADPKSSGETARATIPTDRLLEILQHAESLGYTLTESTWRPLAKGS
ncbi:MAG: hypothetical protein ACODAJ_11540 [Planctomycetota bacterium]